MPAIGHQRVFANASYVVGSVIRGALRRWPTRAMAVGVAGLKVYRIVVDFDQLRVTDPEQRALRDEAQQIPTLWALAKPNLESRQAAVATARLLSGSSATWRSRRI